MVYMQTLHGYGTSLGICVTLTLTSEGKGLVVAKGTKYHREVTIQLPESKPEKWFNLVRTAIAVIEECDRWPIRMDWEEVKQYFTLEDIQKLESSLKDIPFYLYNAPAHIFASRFDLDALYNAKNRRKYQEKCH